MRVSEHMKGNIQIDRNRLISCTFLPKRHYQGIQAKVWDVLEHVFFPECVARVPVSLWGSGGWGCVRSTLRLCSQPSATVRNRSQPSAQPPYGRAYGKFCKRGHFWGFHMWRCFVSRGRRGTSWHSRRVCNVSKVVLCGKRNTFATFSEDALQLPWQAQHFGCVHLHFAWQAQHFRHVALRFFWRITLLGLCQVATRCKQIPRRGIFWDVMKIDGSLARNIDFEVANFQVLRKTRRKTSVLKLQSVKIGGSLVRNSRFDAPTCLVSSLWFSCGLAVPMWGSCKTSPFRRFPSRLSCRFAWQARHFVTFQPVW